MWTTFLVALKANLRNRSALFWMTVFPIVLATMFNGLFGGLAEAYELKPVPIEEQCCPNKTNSSRCRWPSSKTPVGSRRTVPAPS